MAELKTRGLKKSVGTAGLFATAYGNVGSSIYYALGLVAAHALGLTPVVFIFAGGLFALTAKTYAEGAAMFPEAGGSSSFARHAFNEVVSFFAGWGLSLDYIITVAISAFFVPHYLAAFWPALGHGPGDVVAGAAIVTILALLNIRGLGESTKVNIFLALTDLMTQIALVVLGAIVILNPSLLINQVHLGVAPSYSELIFALSISMLAYTGIETVSNMAEEAKDPGEQVPRTVNYVLISVIGLYIGISIVAMSALPVTQNAAGHYTTQLGTTYKDDPVLGIVSALHLHGTVLTAARYYIGALAATILIIATNAGLIGISRLSWSLAEHRQLPGIFSSLHPRYRTPWFTITLFSGIAILLIIPGQTDFLGNLYSFGAMLSFTIAHVSIIALRLKDPLRDRPYRAPWNVNVRGKPVPMTAVFGALGTGAAFASVVALHTEARTVGVGWMILGTIGYFLYRRRQGLDPKAQYRIARPERPAGFAELAYRSALVPILGTSVDNEAMARAAKLVGPDAGVEAVYVLKVPGQLPLDGGLEDEEREGRRVLEVARLQAKVAGCRVRCRLIRTRNPGRAIVDEANERRSDLIYISTEHAPSEERLLGPTTRYVLANRPCRVVVEHDPTAAAPEKHPARAEHGPDGRLVSRVPLSSGGRAAVSGASRP
jgi:basic amino acid/polyamine antiporter, APA family